MLFVAGVSLIFHMAGSDAVHVERGTVRSHLARSRDTERVLVTNGFGSLQPACISRANAGRGDDHPGCHDGRGSNRVRSAIRRSIEIWPSCVNESIRRRLACRWTPTLLYHVLDLLHFCCADGPQNTVSPW
jgi:hypothetical protein